ncbi:hypothetical protein HF086_017285 [Spodoptera exigua]|uniref:Mutant cadherin n=1 Tax=Spodoptera exigua TaxID=7107 RepID=A0A922M108_SPOEX|nr:hypothetical protein HF086_017285 [Spodoptera exigua]
MLAYIQNKVSVIDEDTLVRVCTSSFSKEEIEKSKLLLFESVPGIKIKRKNKGKEERDLADIVQVFKSKEPDLFPIYVARELERLPPVLFDHLDCTKLLKDLLLVQEEVKNIKSTYVSQVQFDQLKSELSQMKYDSLLPNSENVNKRRGAWVLDSGPIGLSHINHLSPEKSNSNLCKQQEFETTPIQFRDIVGVAENNHHNVSAVSQRLAFVKQVTDSGTNVTKPPASASSVKTVTMTSPPHSNAIQNKNYKRNDHDDNNHNDWQVVNYHKKHKRYRYSGSAGICRDNEGKFKAADRKIPIFITRIHNDTTEKDIIDYVFNKTKEMILLEKISFRYEREYKAYKFFIMESKSSLFLDSGLWPQGIIFRRFVNFKRKITNFEALPRRVRSENVLDG